MKTIFATAAALLALAVYDAQAGEPKEEYISGNGWLDSCTEFDPANGEPRANSTWSLMQFTYCVGFVRAIVDTVDHIDRITLHMDRDADRWMCVPTEVTAGDLVRIGLRHFEDHPERVKNGAAGELFKAFRKEFQCRAPSPFKPIQENRRGQAAPQPQQAQPAPPLPNVTTSPEPALPTPATQQPAPPPAAPGVDSKTPVRGGWMIQVGAYLNEQAAKEQLSLVQSKASLMLTDAEAFTDSIEKGGSTLYRARFAGLDKDKAERACEYLKLNDVECVIVKSQERIEPESRQAPATSAWPGAGDPGLPRWLMDEPRTKVRRTR